MVKTKKIKFTWVQCLWSAAGICLFGSACITLLDGHEDLLSVAFPIGLSMLIAGIINVVIYKKKRHLIRGSQWIFTDGISTALLSLFLLFNQMIQAAMIPFFLGVWELFSGVLKTMDAIELKEEKIKGWNWFSGIGIIEIISGVAALLKPVDIFVGMHGVVAAILILQSVGYIFKILIYPRITEG